ncbi:MAG: hypothetical protein OXG88_00640 [Gammaproteobacteria bacterium]|nr:hypothetical protein [Gammaproteobacteria bacterium]
MMPKYRNRHIDQYFLKESIRHRGLIEPLVMTRDKETNELVPFGGGRTRLKLLEELYRETGDPKFAVVDCVEVPPKDRFEIELANMLQNRKWSRKRFVAKALEVFDIVRLHEQETNQKLTETQARNWLYASGYCISKTRFNEMHFVARVLQPVLPNALSKNLNKRDVIFIRKLYRSMQIIWKKFGARDDPFDEAFNETCKLADSRPWDLDYFQTILEREIAISCSFTLQEVRMLLEKSRTDLLTTLEEFRQRDKRTKPKPKLRYRGRRPVPVPAQPTKVSVQRIEVQTRLRDTSIAAGKRRLNYTRSLAFDLATDADLLHCIAQNHDNYLGFTICGRPRKSATPRSVLIWRYLVICQKLLDVNQVGPKIVDAGFRSLTDNDWTKISELIKISCEIGRSFRRFAKKLPTGVKVA